MEFVWSCKMDIFHWRRWYSEVSPNNRFLTLRNPGNQMKKLKPGNLEMWKPTYVQFSQNPLWGQGTEIRGNLRNLRNLQNLQKISLNVWRNSMIYVQLQTKILKSKLDLQWLKKLLQCVTCYNFTFILLLPFYMCYTPVFHVHLLLITTHTRCHNAALVITAFFSFPLPQRSLIFDMWMTHMHSFL